VKGDREALLGSDNGLNEQSGLNCTGRGPTTTGRATTGSKVRQRSVRRKPLSLRCNSLWSDWDREICGENRSRFAFDAGVRDIAYVAGLFLPIPATRATRGRACHLRARGLKTGTWEPLLLACNGSRQTAETGDG
jgi:hypothetical protein